MMADIKTLQWMMQTDVEFQLCIKLLVKHYSNLKLPKDIKKAVVEFFDYFVKQWGPGSHVQNWFAGANPFGVSNNQGLEGTHKEVKKNHTFRSLLRLGEFFGVVCRLVREHSLRDDSLIGVPKSQIFFKPDSGGTVPRDSLKHLTNGYQYFRQHIKVYFLIILLFLYLLFLFNLVILLLICLPQKPTREAWITIKPAGWLTMCDRTDVQIGRVVAIHALRSDEDSMASMSLAMIAKQRLEHRRNPSSTTLNEYFKLRAGCWLVEETDDGEFWCDCPVGFKGKVCKHVLALGYKFDRIEVLAHAHAQKLGEKRQRGRPKKIVMGKENYSAAAKPTSVASEEEEEEEQEEEQEEEEQEEEEEDSPAPSSAPPSPLQALAAGLAVTITSVAPAPTSPATGTAPPQSLKPKRGKCGSCPGCTAMSCGACSNCTNKKNKKACVKKACQSSSIKPKAVRKQPTSPAPPKGTRKRTRALRSPETTAVPRAERRTRQAAAESFIL
jgi:hypothetical protein